MRRRPPAPQAEVPGRVPASMGPSRECDGDRDWSSGTVTSASSLQWGRRVNATETREGCRREHALRLASMGPSRECDGDRLATRTQNARNQASMGPSRECDGDSSSTAPKATPKAASMGPSRECDGDWRQPRLRPALALRLQWGRRVNATETGPAPESARRGTPRASMGPSRECDGDLEPAEAPMGGGHSASMGPSRECDGDPLRASRVRLQSPPLQWGRRVNATETL